MKHPEGHTGNSSFAHEKEHTDSETLPASVWHSRKHTISHLWRKSYWCNLRGAFKGYPSILQSKILWRKKTWAQDDLQQDRRKSWQKQVTATQRAKGLSSILHFNNYKKVRLNNLGVRALTHTHKTWSERWYRAGVWWCLILMMSASTIDNHWLSKGTDVMPISQT